MRAELDEVAANGELVMAGVRSPEVDAYGRRGSSDDPNSQGEALIDLAEVLRFAGRPANAAEAARDALTLFEAKGNTVSAAIARATVGELESLGVS